MISESDVFVLEGVLASLENGQAVVRELGEKFASIGGCESLAVRCKNIDFSVCLSQLSGIVDEARNKSGATI